MDVLNRINDTKRTIVADAKLERPVSVLERSIHFDRPVFSLSAAVRTSADHGIIAEFKRRSPSKGDIRANAKVSDIIPGYVSAGAAAISVLTDRQFFGGSNEDLEQARGLVQVPLLRKDFIIDEYQIFEARAIGADAILLIAASLRQEELKAFTACAHAIGLEVLLEVHDREELEIGLEAGADLIGVNNRDLRTFRTDLGTSRALIRHIPAGIAAIAESGIRSPEAISELSSIGYSGFLIGQHFMEQADPAEACQKLINSILQRS